MNDWNTSTGSAWRAYERSRQEVLRELRAAESMRRHRRFVERVVYTIVTLGAFAAVGVILAWRA